MRTVTYPCSEMFVRPGHYVYLRSEMVSGEVVELAPETRETDRPIKVRAMYRDYWVARNDVMFRARSIEEVA